MSDKYTRDQMVDKIQKLLNLAGDASANEHLAASAAAKAQALMQQWAIDEATLDAAAGKQSDPFTTEDVPFLQAKPQPWEVGLRQAIAAACMVYTFRDMGKGCYTFAGRSADVKVAAFMFVQVRSLLERLSRTRLSEHGAEMKTKWGKSIYNVQQCRVLSGCHPTVYRQRWLDSWLMGAQQGVATKLAEQAAQTNAENSTALVVVETRRDQAKSWATEAFGITNVKGHKARQQFSGAKEQGFKDGRAIELRKGLTAEKQQQLTQED